MASITDTTRKPETFHLTAEAQSALPQQAQIALQQVDNLKYFLISAPVDWSPDQYIRRFLLPTAEYVSCVLWGNLFHITGTDIVRCLAFRFHAFGRPVKNSKKFEEGIFSDLRNLKAGNDASLEEPKSPFLDFLYKNNCIRTQKKQKVFYWYSVPHDRLFLDALERDLKREKAGQEPTTESVSEPSLSFVYDPTRSLYEQLTKPEDQSGDGESLSQSRSPSAAVARAAGSVPPPQQQQPQQQPQHHQMVSSANNYLSGDVVNDNMAYSQVPAETQQMRARAGGQIMAAKTRMMTMNPTSTGMMKSDDFYAQTPEAAYTTIGNASATTDVYGDRYAVRHGSLPTYYMEPSPAPSFVSAQSYYDDNSRAVSYEPVTPPQYIPGYATDYAASSSDNQAGYYYPHASESHQSYSSLSQQDYHSSMAMPPPPAPRFSSVPRRFPSAHTATPAPASYIEGSPHYKQRRRTNSLSTGFPLNIPHPVPQQSQTHSRASPYTVRRPSDLRRSVSASVVPQGPSYERSSSGPPGSTSYMNGLRQTPGASRQSSPLASVENHVITMENHGARPRYSSLASEHSSSTAVSSGPGAMRRARSATSEIAAPYPQRSHTCPIPTCGRPFKRLEHLKRHVRTHTQEKPYRCNMCDKAFSRSDNLAQHRRTHEPNGDFVDDGEQDEEGSDSCAGLTEDVDSPESVTYSTAPMSNMLTTSSSSGVASMDDFGGMHGYGGKQQHQQQHFADLVGDFYDQDCVGVGVPTSGLSMADGHTFSFQ